jgi:4-alpha-glucanotransferase
MQDLHALAQACGLARDWIDVEGQQQRVHDDVLAAILEALGHNSRNARSILADRAAQGETMAAMLVADRGTSIVLPTATGRAEITGEDGVTRPLNIENNKLTVSAEPGYYDLVVDGRVSKLAVAPARCPLAPPQGRKPWGVSLQIPSLRGKIPAPFGTLGELARAAERLGELGADAIAINPVHALFPGCGQNFSPYSPSSRLFLNGAMADPALVGLPSLPPSQSGPLIDWERALPRRLHDLRTVFSRLDKAERKSIVEACTTGGKMLHRHALFDALDCQFRPAGAHGWQDWPKAFHDPESPSAKQFVAENRDEIEFHIFLQWLAGQGIAAAQSAACGKGMRIGLISDLAVGVDPSGSDTWSLRDTMLNGLTIGAPPDPLGPFGQNWSITSFSPDGLRSSGYDPWIAMIRASLQAFGGVRIDHAFGLARLWVIPDGGGPEHGAYLSYPFEDLLRLATLEAHRANALLIAEDLGTAPYGFKQAVSERSMLGMRVLWFERAADDGFIGAQDYEPLSVAMTGTHDTCTVAGWWSGRDLEWADTLDRFPLGIDRAKAEEIRDWDRGLLWSTIAHERPRPAASDPSPVVDAAIAHTARTQSYLALVSLEDMLGIAEQPNLPGTVEQYPNWRHRLGAPIDELLATDALQARCDTLNEARSERDMPSGSSEAI